MRELILGGQRSGKSRRAEALAAAWLAADARHEALLIATAVAGDDEMRERIERHRADRALGVPRMATLEVGTDLAGALREQAAPHRLLVVDCLTLWLTQCLLPHAGPPCTPQALEAGVDALVAATHASAGPLVFVSNEIGCGVSPLGAPARRFVDEIGRLHQQLAAVCDRVTLMVAGLPLTVKPAHGEPR
jgi:adenosylcobinamide kinase/adenosylcobinamide-phosphate guanylyltransferase